MRRPAAWARPLRWFAPVVLALGTGPSLAASGTSGPAAELQPLPRLQIRAYLGTWYQVALYPNFFQRRCVSDTTAAYADPGDGTLTVRNRCRRADGDWDEVVGIARPTPGVARVIDGHLAPARLQVRFAPDWLAWLPWVWGRYWVVELADDGRFAIVGEPDREYLWVLSRTPTLPDADRSAIRSALSRHGFDLDRVEWHPHAPGR
jgi:apolipoprotein D and lipocalin family protein